MQFFCDQCKTKYSIADDKVAGKILKLRCKRCDNTIVLKDPRSSHSESPAHASRGQQLLKDAFKKSFSEDLGSSPDVFPSAASDGAVEERTQIARLPLFESNQPPEEWYLSDSRGQFGPMDFGELVARIKRGEPDHDAVVWREGFDDWKTIDRVPELKLYAKHLPPPRRATREMFRETSSFVPSSPVAAGQYPPVQQNSAVISNPFVNAPVSASQSFRSTGMEYAGSTGMVNPMAALEIQSAAIRSARTRNWILLVILIIVVGAVAFLLGAKLMDKSSDRPSTDAPKVAANPPPGNNAMTPEAQKEEPMREVVYVIASQPPEVEGDPANPNSGMGVKTPGTNRPETPGTTDMGTSDGTMSAPVGTQPRSAADLNAVKQRNIMEIQRCYEMTVRKGQKELVGQVIKFAIRIQASGEVDTVSFTGEMPPLMRACLGSAIQKWQFPAGTKSDNFSFEMHFN